MSVCVNKSNFFIYVYIWAVFKSYKVTNLGDFWTLSKFRNFKIYFITCFFFICAKFGIEPVYLISGEEKDNEQIFVCEAIVAKLHLKTNGMARTKKHAKYLAAKELNMLLDRNDLEIQRKLFYLKL